MEENSLEHEFESYKTKVRLDHDKLHYSIEDVNRRLVQTNNYLENYVPVQQWEMIKETFKKVNEDNEHILKKV